jgi:hypothetical protein
MAHTCWFGPTEDVGNANESIFLDSTDSTVDHWFSCDSDILKCHQTSRPDNAPWARRVLAAVVELAQGLVRTIATQVMHKKQERFDQLVAEEEKAEEEQRSITPKEEKERVQLSLELRLAPKLSEEYMPTKLGNILRAAENRPYERYGLVTAICWPRLWLLLPDGTKQEITEARTTLDTAARIFLWSLLFLVWTVWAWWVPLVTLVIAFWAYRWALSAAVVYGDLLEAAFDLHRLALYEALRFPLPKDTSTEREKGEELTAYMFYGLVAEPVALQKPSDTK